MDQTKVQKLFNTICEYTCDMGLDRELLEGVLEEEEEGGFSEEEKLATFELCLEEAKNNYEAEWKLWEIMMVRNVLAPGVEIKL